MMTDSFHADNSSRRCFAALHSKTEIPAAGIRGGGRKSEVEGEVECCLGAVLRSWSQPFRQSEHGQHKARGKGGRCLTTSTAPPPGSCSNASRREWQRGSDSAVVLQLHLCWNERASGLIFFRRRTKTYLPLRVNSTEVIKGCGREFESQALR